MEREELATMKRAISCWESLSPAQVAFWDVYEGRIAAAHSLVHGSRRWGQVLRVAAILFGVAVPVLAPFQGISRVVVSAVGAAAVVLNGAALVFRVDPRLSVNRKYMADLLDAGWQFAIGGTVPVDAGHPRASTASVEGFAGFKDEVDALRRAYTRDYIKLVDTSPGDAPR